MRVLFYTIVICILPYIGFCQTWNNIPNSEFYGYDAFGDKYIGNLLTLDVIDSRLWVSGGFQFVEQLQTSRYAIFDGLNWATFTEGNEDMRIHANRFYKYKNQVFAGGSGLWRDAYGPGNYSGNYYASLYLDTIIQDWTGWLNMWKPNLMDMVEYHDTLFAVGNLSHSDIVNNISGFDGVFKFDGSSFTHVADGLNGYYGSGMNEVEVFEDKLIIGGEFSYRLYYPDIADL